MSSLNIHVTALQAFRYIQLKSAAFDDTTLPKSRAVRESAEIVPYRPPTPAILQPNRARNVTRAILQSVCYLLAALCSFAD